MSHLKTRPVLSNAKPDRVFLQSTEITFKTFKNAPLFEQHGMIWPVPIHSAIRYRRDFCPAFNAEQKYFFKLFNDNHRLKVLFDDDRIIRNRAVMFHIGSFMQLRLFFGRTIAAYCSLPADCTLVFSKEER